MEKHPEGVAAAARHPFSGAVGIDLNEDLAGGLRPSMPRFAAAFQCEIRGRRVCFASTHLDHAGDPAASSGRDERDLLARSLEPPEPRADGLVEQPGHRRPVSGVERPDGSLCAPVIVLTWAHVASLVRPAGLAPSARSCCRNATSATTGPLPPRPETA